MEQYKNPGPTGSDYRQSEILAGVDLLAHNFDRCEEINGTPFILAEAALKVLMDENATSKEVQQAITQLENHVDQMERLLSEPFADARFGLTLLKHQLLY